MSWLHAQTIVVDGASFGVRFAANWLLQSSLLILAGLFIAWLVKRRGSAVQSVVYRTTLLAVLVCPLATWGLSLAGVSGWSLDMPAAWNEEVAVASVSEEVAMISDYSESTEAKTSAQAERREQNLPLPGPANFPEADVRRPEPLIPQDSERASIPAEDFSPRVSEPDADRSLAAVESPADEKATLSVTTSVFEQPAISNFGLWAMGFCLAWAVIAVALLIRLVWAWRRMVRLCRQGAEADASLSAVCRELASMIGVSPPTIRYSPYVSSPCLGGLSKATILLPELEAAAPVRDVLIHELAHLRRRDCQWNLLRQVATAVFFFQPLLWRLGRRLEATAEEVCDDYVVQFGGDRADYAHQLLDMAERRLASLPMGVGMLSLKSLLARRVIRVLDTSRSLSTRVGNLLLIGILAGGLLGTTIAGFVGLGQKSTAVSAQQPKEKTPEPVEPQKPVEANGEEPAADRKEDAKADEAYRGRLVDEKGQPISGAELHWIRSRVHEIDPAPPRLVDTTNARGEFQFSAPVFEESSPEEPAGWDFLEKIIIKAKGHGVLLTYPGRLSSDELDPAKMTTITLPAAGNSIRGTLLDIEGQPIPGATVRIRWFNERKDVPRRNIEDAEARDEKDALWRSRVNDLLAVIEPFQLRQAFPTARTNAQGQFELKDIGPDRLYQLLIEGEGLESTDLIVRNESGEIIEIAPDRHGVSEMRKVLPREFVQVIGPANPIVGRVLDWKTGEPIAGAVVRAFGVHGERVSSSRERQHFAMKTDDEGRYQITGLPIGEDNELVAFSTGEVPYLPVAHKVNTSGSSREAIVQDFRLKQGIWAEGRVFDKASDKPFTGEISYYFFSNPEWEADVPGIRRAYLDGRYWTDSKGEFRVPVLPSRGVLGFRYSGDDRDRDGIDRYPAAREPN
jgi:beta-lactamase regulating signal transducer with metallopeptidase domain/uncharacterized GH25 family protein